MPIRYNNGVQGERSFATGQNSLSGDAGTASSNSLNGKFTLVLDCDQLLKPDTNRPGVYVSKAAEEATEHLELSTLLTVPIIDHVKIKLFHICGQIEFEEGSCLRTLWGVGDWFVEQYQAMGKAAEYEKWDRGREEDWTEPDAILLVSVNNAVAVTAGN